MVDPTVTSPNQFFDVTWSVLGTSQTRDANRAAVIESASINTYIAVYDPGQPYEQEWRSSIYFPPHTFQGGVSYTLVASASLTDYNITSEDSVSLDFPQGPISGRVMVSPDHGIAGWTR